VTTPEIITTGDGSLSFYSPEFRQAYHNTSGARQEALEKFVRPCLLQRRLHLGLPIRLLDVCFGLGYNAGVALEWLWEQDPECRIHLIGLERSPEVPRFACQQGICFGTKQQLDWQQLVETGMLQTSTLEAQLIWGDARQTLHQIPLAWADAVFWDPFSPSACPELWTVELFKVIRQRMHPQGRLTTYSCAAAVRAAFLEAGFSIGSTPPVGRPWPGTVVSFSSDPLPPLSPAEQEHLQTRAAVPYRDPSLSLPREAIQRHRQQEQQRSCLASTSAWKARWAGNLTV
jgi:tRNA U34 5-methylaminomethyl-2-thiouridine-forming methyltransferase MnmC